MTRFFLRRKLRGYESVAKRSLRSAAADDVVFPGRFGSGAPKTPLCYRSIQIFLVCVSMLIVTPSHAAEKAPSVTKVLKTYDVVLSRAPQFFERGWTEGYEGDPTLGYFAEGKHDELSMRTLGNFITTYAFLSRHPRYDEKVGGVPKAELERKAIAAIRYMIRTNTTGDLTCVGGFKWGDDPVGKAGWESSWYASKMTTGAVMLWDKLTPDDKEGIRKVLASECDRSAANPAPCKVLGDTKSEENAWDCESLAWALVLFPEDVRAATWETTLNSYALNTLSTVDDASDTTVFAGKPLKDWHRGPNIHPDYTIENHGFFHVCYQTCPLHSLAWSVYAYVQAGKTPPPSLLHNYKNVWDQLRRCFLWDGRFAYVGGKDWPRYVYGMNFMFPALALVQNVYNDDYARLIEWKRLQLLKWEQEFNNDGAFFSKRFTNLSMAGRSVEFESDVYADMILAYRLHLMKWPKALRHPSKFPSPNRTTSSPYSSHIMTHGKERFASWSWSPRIKPAQGIFAMRGHESALEWDGNLFGVTRAKGFEDKTKLIRHQETELEGGFVTTGYIQEGFPAQRPPGWSHAADHFLAFIALPDDRTCLIYDLIVAATDVEIQRQGLRWLVGNDIFNGNARKIGGQEITGVSGEARTVLFDKRELDVDGNLCLNVLKGDGPIALRDNAVRNTPPGISWRSLLVEEIDYPYWEDYRAFKKGDVIQRTVIALYGKKKGEDALRYDELDDSTDTPARFHGVIRSSFPKNFEVTVDLSGDPATVQIVPERTDLK